MTFTPQFLDEIRAGVPLADVVGKRVKLQRRGREWIGLCPFHTEKSPSFSVVEDKGFYHCFGCGAHGDVIGFVMRTESLSFPETVEKLAGEAGLALPVTSPEDRQRFEERSGQLKALEAACAWYEHQLRLGVGGPALDYLKGRGLSDETIARFRLGYAPDANDALKSALLKQGFKEREMLEAGLISQPEDGRPAYDFLRGRVIFPISDQRGRIIAFGGRTLGDGQPKYINSRDSELFHKRQALYGLALAREAARETGEVIVAEGYTDVIALHQAGFSGAVAPLGTALTESQIELLWKLTPEPILCFDGDAAGQRAAARAAERALPLLKPGHSLRFALLPAGEDPDSLLRAHGPAALRETMSRARPLVDIVWEVATAGKTADTPERRALIRKDLRDLVAHIAERSVQEAYFSEVESRFADTFDKRRPHRRGDKSRGGKRGEGNTWDMAPSMKSDGNTRVLAMRQQQALLATILNHPELVAEFGEEIGTLRLPSPELDRLRQEIIGHWSPDLDAPALQRHLSEHGFAEDLSRLLSQEVYELASFARPEADDGAVRRGWTQLHELFHRRAYLGEEIDAARQAFASEPSKRNWAYLDALKQRAGPVEEDADQPVVDASGNNGSLPS